MSLLLLLELANGTDVIVDAADDGHFDPSLEGLRDQLPAHLAQHVDGSELAIILQAFGELVDDLAGDFETIYADQALATASDAALRNEWAPLYGAGNESLAALGTEELRAYLQGRAAEDGTTTTLLNTLLGILRSPVNTTGTVLTFPLDGSGLTFPANGAPLVLYQDSLDAPTTTQLTFPGDGSGLLFPANGSGLTFPNQPGRLEVFERISESRIDVYVRDFLAFDRGAFARAVARFRPAHYFASTVTETPTPQLT